MEKRNRSDLMFVKNISWVIREPRSDWGGRERPTTAASLVPTGSLAACQHLLHVVCSRPLLRPSSNLINVY
ncbi:unnamed protein product [Caenorhabditis auriculariae]|uniref:Uncharacterized protein n=1 Tax=Caenorhabditis auriculariae TaxID=2777116 RepID=A0A8S1GYL5_9PELO|nr:unnamed protein product [Caenorhabditis auriculariae]